MKRKISFYLLAGVIILLNSCSSSVKVTSEYDKKADFGNYNTYYFHKADVPDSEHPSSLSAINKQRIENAISKELNLKGYAKSLDPDIWVSYYFKVADRAEYRTTTTYGGMYSPYYGPGYYGSYYGYGNSWASYSTTYHFKEGTLIIDLVDVKANELIWYGMGTKTLNQDNTDPEAAINAAIKKIFNSYLFYAGQKEPVGKQTKNPRK